VSFANCSQLYTVDKERLGRMMGVGGAEVMQRVGGALCRSLQLLRPDGR